MEIRVGYEPDLKKPLIEMTVPCGGPQHRNRAAILSYPQREVKFVNVNFGQKLR